MTNRSILVGAALAAGLFTAGSAANAAPIAAPPDSVASDRADIFQVGGGCPFGLVPDYYGGCRRPFRRYGYGYGGGYGGGYGYGYRPYGYAPPRPFYRPYGGYY